MEIDQGLLHRMQRLLVSYSLYRDDVLTLHRCSRGYARINGQSFTVGIFHNNRACATVTGSTTLFCAFEI